MSQTDINPHVIMFVMVYETCFLYKEFAITGSIEVSGDPKVIDTSVAMFEQGAMIGAAAFGKAISVYFSHKPDRWPDDAHLKSKIVEQFDDIKKKLQEKLESIRENEPDAVPETESGRQPD